MSATAEYSSQFQSLHALDLALGTELFGGPAEVQATYPGTGDNTDGTNVIFDPFLYRERAALLSLNGNIYPSWASHCDFRPYTGWIHGLRRIYTRANQCVESHPKRLPGQHMDVLSRTRLRQFGQHLFF
jgi:hypothetical protein